MSEEIKKTGSPEKTDCNCIILRPAADVADHGNGVEISFEIPGAALENIKLELKDRLLQLSACSFLHRRNLPICYKRAFYLSDAVDAEHIEAKCADGILTLFLPKTANAKTYRIPVA